MERNQKPMTRSQTGKLIKPNEEKRCQSWQRTNAKILEHPAYAIKMERQPRHRNGKPYVQSNRIFGGFQKCESR
jgi:hypothetical protein